MNNYFNDIIEVSGDYYLCQDAEFLDEPMIREINDLLECERDNVQMMLGENYD